jgi:hypothetical protein
MINDYHIRRLQRKIRYHLMMMKRTKDIKDYEYHHSFWIATKNELAEYKSDHQLRLKL